MGCGVSVKKKTIPPPKEHHNHHKSEAKGSSHHNQKRSREVNALRDVYMQMFEQIDIDKNGEITREELQRQYSRHPEGKKYIKKMASMPGAEDGVITKREYMAWVDKNFIVKGVKNSEVVQIKMIFTQLGFNFDGSRTKQAKAMRHLFREVFHWIDKDGSGGINKKELSRRYDKAKAHKKFLQAMTRMPGAEDGDISKAEFMSWAEQNFITADCTQKDVDVMTNYFKEMGFKHKSSSHKHKKGDPKSQETVKKLFIELFKNIDADGSGAITKKELRKKMKTVDEEHQVIIQAMAEMPGAEDGEITKKEFMAWVKDNFVKGASEKSVKKMKKYFKAMGLPKEEAGKINE